MPGGVAGRVELVQVLGARVGGSRGRRQEQLPVLVLLQYTRTMVGLAGVALRVESYDYCDKVPCMGIFLAFKTHFRRHKKYNIRVIVCLMNRISELHKISLDFKFL